MGVLEDHRQACDGFSHAVHRAGGQWAAPSPCTEWDARGVVEHVIGFHDMLLLRPLDSKPTRPKDDPETRWAVTVEAIFEALARPGALDEKRTSLLGVLTTDVLVHTWDLCKAIGAHVSLDPRLSEVGLRRAMANREQLHSSGWFGPPVEVDDDASVQDRLLGIMGRDPAWSPPT